MQGGSDARGHYRELVIRSGAEVSVLSIKRSDGRVCGTSGSFSTLSSHHEPRFDHGLLFGTWSVDIPIPIEIGTNENTDTRRSHASLWDVLELIDFILLTVCVILESQLRRKRAYTTQILDV